MEEGYIKLSKDIIDSPYTYFSKVFPNDDFEIVDKLPLTKEDKLVGILKGYNYDCKILITTKEFDLVNQILSCQIGCWFVKRINPKHMIGQSCYDGYDGLDRGCTCAMHSIHNVVTEKIKEYETTYGRKFHDFNKEIILG